jgi:hypothetical protein
VARCWRAVLVEVTALILEDSVRADLQGLIVGRSLSARRMADNDLLPFRQRRGPNDKGAESDEYCRRDLVHGPTVHFFQVRHKDSQAS